MWRSLTALSRGRESTAWSRRWCGWPFFSSSPVSSVGFTCFGTSLSRSPTLFRVSILSWCRLAAGFFWANGSPHCAGAELRWSLLGWLWWQSRSHRWRNACDFSGLLSNCRVLAELRRRSACFETGHGNFARNVAAKSADNLAGYSRCRVNDNFILHYPGSAPAIRPELSLSLPRFERDFHHADSRGSVEGKVKPATYRWRSADQRRYRARFNELEFRPVKNFKQILY